MIITEFLEARIAEDERQAGICHELGWSPAKKYGLTAVGPTRILAECAAKRAIIGVHVPVDYSHFGMKSPNACSLCGADLNMSDWEWISDSFPCQTIRALAAVYADHPDYRGEWTP